MERSAQSKKMHMGNRRGHGYRGKPSRAGKKHPSEAQKHQKETEAQGDDEGEVLNANKGKAENECKHEDVNECQAVDAIAAVKSEQQCRVTERCAQRLGQGTARKSMSTEERVEKRKLHGRHAKWKMWRGGGRGRGKPMGWGWRRQKAHGGKQEGKAGMSERRYIPKDQ